MAGLMTTLSKGKTTLSSNLLIRTFKALVWSKLDYGAVALNGIPPSTIKQLDSTQNKLLRIIMGAARSTSIPSLCIETGIAPIGYRWNDLAARYLLTLNNKKWNSAYATIGRATNSNITWVKRSIPAVIPVIQELLQGPGREVSGLQRSTLGQP